MPASPPKTPFRCPECGFVQLEPPHVVSTNCRSCGTHYEPTAAERLGSGIEASLPTFAGKKQSQGKPVHCFKCGRTHEVSQKAQSTICPGCYAPIELIEVAINNNAFRAIDTRGHLKVGPKGHISNPWIICGSARVEGSVEGELRCEGELRLSMEKPCRARIRAASVLVEKRSHIELSQALEADTLTVQGKLLADVRSTGTVRILKGGWLEGSVHASGISVEKGGVFFGQCQIRKEHVPEPAGPVCSVSEESQTQEEAG